MPQSIEAIAEAFSRHRFHEAIPSLAEDVTWSLVGEDTLTGKPAVVAACESTTSELEEVTTVFSHFRLVVDSDCVVVDSVAEYTDATGGTSVVASCDIYDFVDGRVSRIRSYNIEEG
jgi:ketosteroid isomerase-like protein